MATKRKPVLDQAHRVVNMTWLPGEHDHNRGMGDYLCCRATSDDAILRLFYHGPYPVNADEIPDLFMAANEHDFTITIKP